MVRSEWFEVTEESRPKEPSLDRNQLINCLATGTVICWVEMCPDVVTMSTVRKFSYLRNSVVHKILVALGFILHVIQSWFG